MAKYEVGDWIIHPGAIVPKYIEILEVTKEVYVCSYNKDGSINSYVPIEDEDDWELGNIFETMERRMKKEIGL